MASASNHSPHSFFFSFPFSPAAGIPMPIQKFTSLPDLLKRPETLVVPGGGTALELRLAQLAGFEAGYVSGYATSAAVFISRNTESEISFAASNALFRSASISALRRFAADKSLFATDA